MYQKQLAVVSPLKIFADAGMSNYLSSCMRAFEGSVFHLIY